MSLIASFVSRASVFVFAAALLGGAQAARAQTGPIATPPWPCFAVPVTTVGHGTLLTSGAYSGQYRLTSALNTQLGAIWSTTRADLTAPFDYSAWVYLGANAGGADGMTFTLHNDSRGAAAIGYAGRGVGAGDGYTTFSQPGIARSLMVEFDTYSNGDNGWNDPAGDHIAVYTNANGRHASGSGFPTPYSFPATIKDNQYHLFRATWTPTTLGGTINVYFNGTLRQTYTVANRNTLFGSNMVYWGYTASTGGLNNEHRVCNVGAPASPLADYGDAPQSYGQAWHLRPSTPNLILGPDAVAPSTETGPRFSADGLLDEHEAALFDNLAGSTPPIWSGGVIPVAASGANGYLNAWIDWNRNGLFEASEQVATNLRNEDPLDLARFGAGDSRIQFMAATSASLSPGLSFMRLRWSTQPNLGPTGEAPDGEVEDHPIMLVAPTTHNCTGTIPSNFATTGAGLYKDKIFWLDWSCGAAQFNAGDTVVKTWTLPSGHQVRGTLSGLTGSLEPYAVGTWSGDGLRHLYGGLNPIGLANRHVANNNSPNVSFTLNLELISPSGAATPYRLTTIAADAEDLSGANESFAITTNGAPWRIVDSYNSLSASFSNGGRTVYMTDPVGVDSTLVLGSAGGTQMTATIDPGGKGAAAFGVFLASDHGDAPSSYGAAAHLQEEMFSGGAQPTTHRAIVAADRAALGYGAALRMGALLDVEAAPSHSADARGDDQTDQADEDGASFSAFHANGLPRFRPGEPHLVTVNVTGPGYLSAWADWNRDGSFAGEPIALGLTDGAAGDLDPAAGRIGFLATPPASLLHGESFVRLRWSSGTVADPGAAVSGGEAEDYRIQLEKRADIRLDMTISNLAPVLGESFTVELTLTNEGLDVATDVVARYLAPLGYAYAQHPEFHGSTPAGTGYDAASGLWTARDFAPGESRKLVVHLRPMSAATLSPILHVAEVTSHSHVDLDSTPGDGDPLQDDYAAATVTARTVPLSAPGAFQCSSHPATLDWSSATLNSGSTFAAQFSFAGSSASVVVSPAPDAGWPQLRGSGPTGGLELAGASGFADISLQFHPPIQNLRLPLRGFGPSAPDRIAGVSVNATRGGGLVQARVGGGAGISVSTSGALTVYDPAFGPGDYHLTFDFDQAIDTLSIRIESAQPSPDPVLRWDLVPWRLELGAPQSCLMPPVLSPNHESAVPPGQLAIYEHQLTLPPSLNGSALSFSMASEQGLAWRIFIDDGDGIFNADQDMIWPQGANVAAGSLRFWLVAQVPHDAPAGWRDLTRLRATLSQGGASSFAEVQDVTRVGGGLEGQIHARKSAALDANCDGVPDLGEAGFVAEVSVINAVCVLYRVSFENRSVTPVTQVRVQDHTPDWTTYVGDSAKIVPPSPPGLQPPTIASPADGAPGAILFAFDGALAPGDKGIVQFGAKVVGPVLVLPNPSTPPVKPN